MRLIVRSSAVLALSLGCVLLAGAAELEKDVFTAAQRRLWSLQKVVRPSVPVVKAKDWVRTPVDAFILSKLEEKGLSPSKQADRVTLLRRLSLDVIGLPPTPEEVDAFVSDKSPNAWEKQVDRLLASPHYGERWG